MDAILRRHGLSTSAIRRSKHRPHGLLLDGEDIYTSYLVHAGQVVATSPPALRSTPAPGAGMTPWGPGW